MLSYPASCAVLGWPFIVWNRWVDLTDFGSEPGRVVLYPTVLNAYGHCQMQQVPQLSSSSLQTIHIQTLGCEIITMWIFPVGPTSLAAGSEHRETCQAMTLLVLYY